MWEELVILFVDMTWFPAVCLILGLIFLGVEMFVPGFGIFGSLGIAFIIVGIVARVANSGRGNPLVQFGLLLLLVLFIVAILFIIMVRSAKRGLISKSPLVENDTAVPVGHTDGTKNYSFLIGQIGIALTPLRPSGMVAINDVEYDVVAAGFFIDKGEPIIVINTEGVKIVVKRVDNADSGKI